jgi:hypothetical protein
MTLPQPDRCDWCRAWTCTEQHEILRGTGLRPLARDQACATLWLCNPCHTLMGGRSWEEQLAILCRVREDDYNLATFHKIAKRRKPDHDEVQLWLRRYWVLRS